MSPGASVWEGPQCMGGASAWGGGSVWEGPGCMVGVWEGPLCVRRALLWGRGLYAGEGLHVWEGLSAGWRLTYWLVCPGAPCQVLSNVLLPSSGHTTKLYLPALCPLGSCDWLVANGMWHKWCMPLLGLVRNNFSHGMAHLHLSFCREVESSLEYPGTMRYRRCLGPCMTVLRDHPPPPTTALDQDRGLDTTAHRPKWAYHLLL